MRLRYTENQLNMALLGTKFLKTFKTLFKDKNLNINMIVRK